MRLPCVNTRYPTVAQLLLQGPFQNVPSLQLSIQTPEPISRFGFRFAIERDLE